MNKILRFIPRYIHEDRQYGDVWCGSNIWSYDVTKEAFDTIQRRISLYLDDEYRRIVSRAVEPQMRVLGAALRILQKRKQAGVRDGCAAIGTRIVRAMAAAEKVMDQHRKDKI